MSLMLLLLLLLGRRPLLLLLLLVPGILRNWGLLVDVGAKTVD